MREDQCPVGDCDRMKIVEGELFDRNTGIKARINEINLTLKDMLTKEDIRKAFRTYLNVFIGLALVCITSLIVTWAKAEQIPTMQACIVKLEGKAVANEKRSEMTEQYVVLTEKRNDERFNQILEELKRIKTR